MLNPSFVHDLTYHVPYFLVDEFYGASLKSLTLMTFSFLVICKIKIYDQSNQLIIPCRSLSENLICLQKKVPLLP